jgi:hypothetical protein
VELSNLLATGGLGDCIKVYENYITVLDGRKIAAFSFSI